MLMLIHEEPEDQRNGSVISLTPAEIFKNFKKQDEERETLQLKERIKQTQDNLLNVDRLDRSEVFYDPKKEMEKSKAVSISSILMKPQIKKGIELESIGSSNLDKVKPIDILKKSKFSIQCKKNECVEQTKLNSDILGNKVPANPTSLLKNGKFGFTEFENRTFPATLRPNLKSLKSAIDKPISFVDSEDEDLNEKVNPTLIMANGKFNLGNPRKSKLITFKLDPVKLRAILDKPTFNVSLQVSSLKMKTILASSSKPVKKLAIPHPFFKEISEKIKNSSTFKSNKRFNEEKGVLVTDFRSRFLSRNEFHVKNLSDHEINAWDILLKQKNILNLKNISSENYTINYSPEEFLFFFNNCQQVKENSNMALYSTTIDFEAASRKISYEKYDNFSDRRFKKFIEKEHYSADITSQWCDLYRPNSSQEILQSKRVSSDLKRWLDEAFTRLKKVDKFKRRKRLKNKNKKKGELDDFIIDFTDDNATEEETFVPSLIIEGPIGCGKTSAINSIISEQIGGFVFELNSSQSRARKDIDFHLKQIGTTLMVKQNLVETKSSEDKTLILFDDVDLIDEEDRDKDFWLGVTELLSYSYRPIVFTTSDLSKIPINIVNESAVYRFEKIPEKTLFEYLDLISLNRHFNIDKNILKNFCKYDLRRALMELQMFSYRFDSLDVGLVNIFENKSNGSNFEVSTEAKASSGVKAFAEFSRLSLLHDIKFAMNEIPQDQSVEDFFENDKFNCLEFYSSKLISNGSRSKCCRYQDGRDYSENNIGNLFDRLTKYKIATDVIPMIKEIAKAECLRVGAMEETKGNYEKNRMMVLLDDHVGMQLPTRRFELNPTDIFLDLFIEN